MVEVYYRLLLCCNCIVKVEDVIPTIGAYFYNKCKVLHFVKGIVTTQEGVPNTK